MVRRGGGRAELSWQRTVAGKQGRQESLGGEKARVHLVLPPLRNAVPPGPGGGPKSSSGA